MVEITPDSKNALTKEFECICCMTVAWEDPFACSTCGIIVCHVDAPKLKDCPQCRAQHSLARNMFAKKLVGDLAAECDFGCGAPLKYSQLSAHQTTCPKRNVKCAECNTSFAMDQFKSHLTDSHWAKLVTLFDASATPKKQKPKPDENESQHADRVNTKFNCIRKQARIGSTGKYYCAN